MAKIVPSDLTRLALCGTHEPEIETLAILRRSREQLAARIQTILPPEQPGPSDWADKAPQLGHEKACSLTVCRQSPHSLIGVLVTIESCGIAAMGRA